MFESHRKELKVAGGTIIIVIDMDRTLCAKIRECTNIRRIWESLVDARLQPSS